MIEKINEDLKEAMKTQDKFTMYLECLKVNLLMRVVREVCTS